MQASETAGSARKRVPLVYLVDDEEVLLSLGDALLRGEGCATRTFQNPESAWESFQVEEVKPQLLVADFSMGGKMTGLDLIERCKNTAPGIKTLLVSGSISPATYPQQAATVDSFLPKPYRAADFLKTVRQLLAV